MPFGARTTDGLLLAAWGSKSPPTGSASVAVLAASVMRRRCQANARDRSRWRRAAGPSVSAEFVRNAPQVIARQRLPQSRIIAKVQDALPRSAGSSTVSRASPPHHRGGISAQAMRWPILPHRVQPGLVDELEQPRGGRAAGLCGTDRGRSPGVAEASIRSKFMPLARWRSRIAATTRRASGVGHAHRHGAGCGSLRQDGTLKRHQASPVLPFAKIKAGRPFLRNAIGSIMPCEMQGNQDRSRARRIGHVAIDRTCSASSSQSASATPSPAANSASSSRRSARNCW